MLLSRKMTRCFFHILTLFAALFLCVRGTMAETDPDPTYNKAAESMTGLYTGDFGNGKITICLQKIVGTTVLGYSVTSGNERAFSGSFKDNGGTMEFVVREPGDDKGDGEFQFKLAPGKPKLIGSWTQYKDRSQSVTYELEKKTFKYNPKLGQYPQSSTRLLTEADVENMMPEELRIMRNEIYARHGYSFRMADMRKHFSEQPWYMPMSSDVSTVLTKTEEKNAALIKRYENYGEEYYDKFGR